MSMVLKCVCWAATQHNVHIFSLRGCWCQQRDFFCSCKTPLHFLAFCESSKIWRDSITIAKLTLVFFNSINVTISIYRRAATNIFSSLINLYVIFLKYFKVAPKMQLLLSLMPQTSLQFAKKLVKPEVIKLAVMYD